MKRIFYAILFFVTFSISAQVYPGIDVLRENNFDILKGKRVGLITNRTGVDSNLRSTIDILHEAPEVTLVALFAPEHGIRGDAHAGATVSNSKDAVTGLPIYSLYGSTKKPTASMLKDVDVLVYDIQDNGCRSYTFISTMGLAMEAAAANGVKFVVLDRPNPVGGNKVEGPIRTAECTSFISQYPIPYLYGLTPGELALYLKGEGLIKNAGTLDLQVVAMDGWRRPMTYDLTGLEWLMPSPHIPTADVCFYYPASGILGELDFLSIGVGYTIPFKSFAAPWINGIKLADRLNALDLPGVMFYPISYKPYYGKFKGQDVSGVQMFITDPQKADLTLMQFYVMQELHELYPSKNPFEVAAANHIKMFDYAMGDKKIRSEFSKRFKVADILPIWNKDVESFTKKKSAYHLYK